MSDIVKKYQTFVSSTYEDLREERNKVVEALLESDCIPTGMELFPASYKSSWEVIETVIKNSDIYVVIIGKRYGSLCEDGRSFTEREYDLAKEANKRILAFLPKEISYDDSESNEMRTKLDKFINKIKANQHTSFYRNVTELRAEVIAAAGKQIKDMPNYTGWIRQSDVISSGYQDYSISLPDRFTIFISGATGVGKSTIARRLMTKIPRFIVLEESDLAREDIRATLHECIKRLMRYLRKNEDTPRKHRYSKSDIAKILDLSIADDSTKNLTINEIEKQCQWMTPAMRQKCQRLYRLKMPAIFEGVGISFKIMCNDDYFKSLCNSMNALFINLILPDTAEHKRRLRQRCEDRGEEFQIINEKFEHIKEIGETFNKQAEILNKKYKNVINIDCSGSSDTTVRLIIEAISRI